MENGDDKTVTGQTIEFLATFFFNEQLAAVTK